MVCLPYNILITNNFAVIGILTLHIGEKLNKRELTPTFVESLRANTATCFTDNTSFNFHSNP